MSTMVYEAWSVQDIEGSKCLGPMEFEGAEGETDYVEVVRTKTHLVFGGACNAGFLQSGYLEKHEDESWDEALVELRADLETFYRDGAKYTSRIVVNERM